MSLKLPGHIRYLAVEGVIGVGKSTLVRFLAEVLNCRTLFEDFEQNPFLGNFYQDRHKYAFQTQLFFLLSRYRQIEDTFQQQNLFAPVCLADYMFAKDRIFASQTLDENEMALYDSVSLLMEKKLVKPDFTVYLQADTEVLLERIRLRDRTYERNMDEKYIAALNESYNSFFMHYQGSPLMIVNTNEIDFVKNSEDFELLLRNICKAPQGTTYYSPMG